nr:MAG TPA: hypothetical protein [Caudoviricetes sp.]
MFVNYVNHFYYKSDFSVKCSSTMLWRGFDLRARGLSKHPLVTIYSLLT